MSNENGPCPQCGSQSLTLDRYADTLRVDDQSILVTDLERMVCAACGADPVFTEQIRRNDRRYADARRRLRGLATGAEIAEIRTRLNISQTEASALFGGGANAFSKYERGEVIQSVAMDRLLKLACALPEAFELLRQLSGTPGHRTPRTLDSHASTPSGTMK
jgi:HTH-type transcriptional regulator/antitoxin MqsA